MNQAFNSRPLALIAFIVVLGAGISTQSSAQTARTLTLTEAIELGIKNSKQLKMSQEAIQASTLRIQQIRENQLPNLDVSASYLRLNTPNVNLKLGKSDSSGTSPNVNQAMYGMVSASLPLFSGFRFKYGLESAHYLEQASRLDAENDRQAVIQNTVAAYSNLYKSQKSVELVTENLLREHQRVEEFTNKEKNGLLARNDLLKATLQESNMQLALLEAENDLKVTTITINLLLGLPENTVTSTDSSSFLPLNDAGNAATWEESAMEKRKDMASLGLRQKAANYDIKVAKADLYPSIALTAGYIAIGIPGVITVPNAMNAGIGVKYSIGSLWKSNSKIEEAHLHLSQLRTREAILSDQIHLEVNTAYYNYLLSKKKIDVYAKAVEQANENYRITKNKYDNNLVTTTELLDADVAQVQAKINYASAQADAVVAFKKLEQSAGLLN